jgi:hypothetical protein
VIDEDSEEKDTEEVKSVLSVDISVVTTSENEVDSVKTVVHPVVKISVEDISVSVLDEGSAEEEIEDRKSVVESVIEISLDEVSVTVLMEVVSAEEEMDEAVMSVEVLKSDVSVEAEEVSGKPVVSVVMFDDVSVE